LRKARRLLFFFAMDGRYEFGQRVYQKRTDRRDHFAGN